MSLVFFDTMYKNKSELECQKVENIEYGTVHAIFSISVNLCFLVSEDESQFQLLKLS